MTTLGPVTRVMPGTDDVPALYLNRELTWLSFNCRVLYQALDTQTPLLERVRFLEIFTSNLDEFYMKRVGGLKRQVVAGVSSVSIDGMTAAQQLAAIRETVIPMLDQQAECFTDSIVPELNKHGVHLLDWEDLTDAERRFAQDYFQRHVFAVLTPFAVDPGHPFPFLSNLSMSLGVTLAHLGQEDRLFARVKVPEVLPSWVKVESGEFQEQRRFISLVEVISHNLDALFPGMEVLSVTPFRVTRNADVEADEEDAEDLLELIEQELRQRRVAEIVRLEHGRGADPWTIEFLMQELELGESDVYELPAELNYSGLEPISSVDISSLRFSPWTPVIPPILAGEDADLFSVVRSGDLMVHHPYESFSASVDRFISSAADDSKVLAIKLTLYRIGDSRSLVNSLSRAAEAGKQVVCLVELKARFDEQRNIHLAQELERAGVHVVYGVVGLKTHTKLALVIRREGDVLRGYAHIGTGNYNAQTAKLYTDFGLFTCNSKVTEEVVELFHYLTGRSTKDDYQHLMVAPLTMRKRFAELIDKEIENKRQGQPAQIIAKMNSLEDRKIIRKLYDASCAGVQIDLIVRGFCCLRPGVEGMSENIRVISVVGRFLEHSRVFYFRNGAEQELDGRFYIGSADWMYRNLNQRVEVITAVYDAGCRQKLWQVLSILRDDDRQCWDMQPDGGYILRQPTSPSGSLGTHRTLMKLARAEAGLPVENGDNGDHDEAGGDDTESMVYGRPSTPHT